MLNWLARLIFVIAIIQIWIVIPWSHVQIQYTGEAPWSRFCFKLRQRNNVYSIDEWGLEEICWYGKFRNVQTDLLTPSRDSSLC